MNINGSVAQVDTASRVALKRFAGTTVLVTGATGGLGYSLAHAYAEEGAAVVVGGRRLPAAKEVAEEVSAADGRALCVQLDVTSEADWAAAVAATEEAFGPVHVLVNNAADLRLGSTETCSVADWSAVLETNLTGVFLGIRAVAPSMRRAGRGSILNIGSTAGFDAVPGFVAYATSKWGLRGLTKAAALELARDGIVVNSLHPGVIETPMANNRTTGDALVPVSTFPMPRRADVAEISRYALFMTSPEASFSTGSEFVADGGQLLGSVPEAFGA